MLACCWCCSATQFCNLAFHNTDDPGLVLLQAAVEVRKQVNQLDNLTTSKAVDALLNAETVALFGNRQLEVSPALNLLQQWPATALRQLQGVSNLNHPAGSDSATLLLYGLVDRHSRNNRKDSTNTN